MGTAQYLLRCSSSTGIARRIRCRHCVGDTQQQAPRTVFPTPPFLNRILRRLRLVPYADFERPRMMFKDSNTNTMTTRYDGIGMQISATAFLDRPSTPFCRLPPFGPFPLSTIYQFRIVQYRGGIDLEVHMNTAAAAAICHHDWGRGDFVLGGK